MIYGGCISSYTCDKCGKIYICDSSGKAGTIDGNITYIWGPCCCGYNCPDCYPNGRFDKIIFENNWKPLNISQSNQPEYII